MKAATQEDTRIQRTAYGPTALGVGLPVLLVGSYFALAAAGLLPLPGGPGGLNAPLWVVGAIGLAFVIGGGMLTLRSLQGLSHRRRAERMRRLHPDQPWLADYRWDPSGIADESARRPGYALLGVTLLVVFLAPFNWWAFFSGDTDRMLKVAVTVFDLAALAAVLTLVYRLAQWAKYGSSRLAFAVFPFAPGEALRVAFFPNRFGRLQTTLRFVEERFEETRSAGERHAEHRAYEHYAESRDFEGSGHGTWVHMQFDLPDNPAWVTKMSADPGIRYWELVVRSDVPGVDFYASFPLPVYPHPRKLRTENLLFHADAPAGEPVAGYRFEIMVGLLAVALAIVAVLIRPSLPTEAGEWLKARWQSLDKPRLSGVLRRVDGIAGSEVMDLVLDARGSVWVLTKYELSRFEEAGGAYRKDVLLNPERYRKEIGGEVVSLSAFLARGADDVLVGDWQGGLFVHQAGAWRTAFDQPSPVGRRVRALREHGGSVYVAASNGLWRWQGGRDSRPERVAGLPRGDALALAEDGERLLVAIGAEIWRLEENQWTRHARLPDAFGDIAVMQRTHDGRLLVGGAGGMATLDAGGAVGAQELPGMQVSALFDDGGQLWVGAWNDGVAVRSGEAWQLASRTLGLPGTRLQRLAVDRQGDVWLGYYDAGVARVAKHEMLKAMAGSAR